MIHMACKFFVYATACGKERALVMFTWIPERVTCPTCREENRLVKA